MLHSAPISTISSAVASPTASIFLHNFRRYRLGCAELGDTVFERFQQEDFSAVWYRSPSRGLGPDIIIYYVHGGSSTCSSVYFYTEFIIKLMGELQIKGFKNPAVCSLNLSRSGTFYHHLAEAASCWCYLSSTFPSTSIALFGDGTGATLILSLLLHIARPAQLSLSCQGVNSSAAFESSHIRLPTPESVVLISPYIDMNSLRSGSASDIISPQTVEKYRKIMADDVSTRQPVYFDPGSCKDRDWWMEALPPKGLYISYGENESFAKNVEQFFYFLKPSGKIFIEASADMIHCWPVVRFFTGRSDKDHIAGVRKMAAVFSELMLWHSRTDGKYYIRR